MRAIREMLTRCAARERRPAAAEVTAAELERWLAEGRAVQLVDIRETAGFQSGHLPGSLHVPLDRLEQELGALDRGLATVVY